MKKIIPCLDIRDNKVVKGINFAGVQEVGNPIEFSLNYVKQGADELVLYDISASLQNRIIPLEIIKNIKDNIKIPLTVAGGIATVNDFEKVLNAGADKVSVNSQAVKNPGLIKEASDKYGCEVVVVGIDAKRAKTGAFIVTIGGGKVETDLSLVEWAKKAEALGAGEICLNSIDMDGVKSGYDINMINSICKNVNIPVIASGGCGRIEHFLEVFSKTRATSALAASVFHYNELTIEEVKKYLKNEGIPVNI